MADIAAQPFVNYNASMQQAQLDAAQTANLGQRTQAQAMENQITRASMPLIMDALKDYQGDNQQQTDQSGVSSSGAPTAPAKVNPNPQTQGDQSGVASDTAQDPNQGWFDPARADAALRNHFYVQPITPQEQQQLRRGAVLSGRMPGLLEMAKMQRDQRIQMQTSTNQMQAGNMFDAMRSVVDAPPGRALDILDSVLGGNSDTVAKIKKQLPAEADEDAAARVYARHLAGSVHQYTGREVMAGTDGNYRDKASGFVVPGVERVGLSDEQWSQIANRGMQLTEVPDGAGGKIQEPLWKTQAQSLDQWVMMQAAARGEHSAQPTVGGAPKDAARTKASTAAKNAQDAAAKGGQQETRYVGPDGKVDPTMSKALSDHEYDFAMPHTPAGHEPPPEVVEARKNAVSSAQALKKDAGDATKAAATMKAYLVAADDVLKNGDPTGKWNGIVKEAAQWLPQTWQPNTVPNRQELAKYLGNAALSNARAIYGSRMTQSEVKLQLNELSPEAGMSEKAIRQMIDTNMRNADYAIQTSRRANAYLGQDAANPRRDPTKFADWNQHYFPLEDAMNKKPAAAAPVKYSEEKLQAYARKYNMPIEQVRQHFGAK